jgi:hypothetical protein
MKTSKLNIGLVCLGVFVTALVRGDSYSGTNLWLEITGRSNQLFSFNIHNTPQYQYYEILAKTDLTSPVWIPTGAFYATPVNGVVSLLNQDESCYWWANSECYWVAAGSMPKTLYFRACAGNADLRFYPCNGTYILGQPPSTNMPGQSLTFNIDSDKMPAPLPVNFQLIGSAVNGLDYSITGMQVVGSTGSMVIPAGANWSSNIVITPLPGKTNGISTTLTIAMALGSNYVFDLGNEAISLIFTNKYTNTIPVIITNISPNPFDMTTTNPITILGSGFFPALNMEIHVEDALGGMDSDGYWMKATLVNSGEMTAVYGGSGNGVVGPSPGPMLVYYQDATGKQSNVLNAIRTNTIVVLTNEVPQI